MVKRVTLLNVPVESPEFLIVAVQENCSFTATSDGLHANDVTAKFATARVLGMRANTKRSIAMVMSVFLLGVLGFIVIILCFGA